MIFSIGSTSASKGKTRLPILVGRREAFTLIELLTVIAILGILAAILIPVTAQVRSAARQTQCASNLRQIGVAIRLYADDNNGFLPETSHRDRTESWIFSLSEYLDDVDEVRICPADPRADEKRLAESATSYVVNDLIFSPAQDEFGRVVGGNFRRIDLLETPSRTIIAFIGADHRGMAASDDHTHASNWAGNWSGVLNDIAPDRHGRSGSGGNRTSGSAVYLFADGHVENLRAIEIYNRIQAGENIAMPPEFR